MATLQETAVTWHIINARSHTAVMEYGSSCIWVSVCDSLPQRGGIFFSLLFSFFLFFSQEAEGNEASRLLKPTSASKLMHVRSVLGDFAYLIHAQHRHGGCPSVLWSSCSGWLGYSTRSSVTYVLLSCDISLSRANCTCKRARQAEERPDVHRAVEEA